MITLLSWFSGSLGVSLVINSQWWFWLADMSVKEQEEEEDLTQYQTQAKPQNPTAKVNTLGWEFKILRAQHNIFHRPETLKKVCQEEAQGGWILLEKLDDRRLRFKRPMQARQRPIPGNYDPYRSFYGQRWSLLPWFSGILVLLMTTLPAYLAYRLVTLELTPAATPTPPTHSSTYP